MKKMNKKTLSISILAFFVVMILSTNGSNPTMISPTVSGDRPGWSWSEFGIGMVASLDSDQHGAYTDLTVKEGTGEVFAIWSDGYNLDGQGDNDIFLSTLTGSTFGGMGDMTPASTDHSGNPSIVCDTEGGLTWVWQESTNDDGQGDYDIYLLTTKQQ